MRNFEDLTPRQRAAVFYIAFFSLMLVFSVWVWGVGAFIGWGLGGLTVIAMVAWIEDEDKKNV